ncbi:MAG: DinB family protein [Rubripirellula sp.]|nr:DinB family protein [Rubripirellula sp.]
MATCPLSDDFQRLSCGLWSDIYCVEVTTIYESATYQQRPQMTRIASRRPESTEVGTEYQRGLIDQLEGQCVLKALDDQLYWICELASHLCTEQIDKVHASYGWSIRQVFEHCVDAERVFGYRMLRIAAGDSTALPGWDENAYADRRFGLGNFSGLVAEFGHLRQANLLLLRRIVPASWDLSANVDGFRITVRAIAWLTAGHLHHHLGIVEQRCGVAVARTAAQAMMDQQAMKS